MGRLTTYFSTASVETQIDLWKNLWSNNENHFWDRDGPSQDLGDYLTSKQINVDLQFEGSSSTKRVLVPACGLGRDVRGFARFSFQTFGLEVSDVVIAKAREYLLKSDPTVSQLENNITFIEGDFFSTDWEAKLPFPASNTTGRNFDIIFDYTFLCALTPKLREPWAKRMAELIKPGGLLICLEFPLWKDLNEPGPPWGLKGVHWNLLAEGGDGMNLKSEPSLPLRGNFDRIRYIHALKSHKEGRGTDMLSIWRRKESSTA